MAGAIHLSGGCPVRIVGVYAVTGASLPGLDSDPSKLAEEASVQFVREQLRLADELSIPCICMGDFNSVASLDLDVWHGSHVLRPSSLAAHMPSFDCVDTFRLRHAGLRAYTVFAHSGSASRLDGIWSLSPRGAEPLPLLNSAVLVGWRRRVDHEPVLADFLAARPLIPLPALLLGVFWQRPLSPALCPNWSRYVTPWQVPLPRAPLLQHLEEDSFLLFSLSQPSHLFFSSCEDWMVPVRVHLRICAAVLSHWAGLRLAPICPCPMPPRYTSASISCPCIGRPGLGRVRSPVTASPPFVPGCPSCRSATCASRSATILDQGL